MRTQVQKSSIIFMLMLLTGWFTAANAQPQRGMRSGNCMAAISNLTEKQETKIEDMRKAHFDEMEELRDNRRAAVSWERKAEIGVEIMEARLEHMKAIRNVLNDEQQEAFDKYLNTHPRSALMHGNACGKKYGRGHGRPGKGRGGNPGGRSPRW